MGLPVPAHSSDAPSPCAPTPKSVSSFTSVTIAANVRAAFKKPSNWMLILGNVLACCAGIVNAIAIRELSTMVSNMTGNSSRIGLRLEGVHNSGLATHIQLSESVLIVVSFIAGAFLCGLLIDKNQLHFGGKAWYGAALLGNSALLCVAALTNKTLAPYPAAMALGLQNAMCTSHFGAVVRTTHVTGSVTDIGSTLGRITMLHIRKLARGTELTTVEKAEIEVDTKKLIVLVPIVLSFVFGCYQGGFLEMWFGTNALFVPASVTGSIGIIYTCFRHRLKQYLKKLQKAGEADSEVIIDDEECDQNLNSSDSAPATGCVETTV